MDVVVDHLRLAVAGIFTHQIRAAKLIIAVNESNGTAKFGRHMKSQRGFSRPRRFLPAAKKRGRPRTALREVLNGILYLVKTGAQWRLLPKNFPPWQTVYHHFRQWSRNG